MRQIRFRVYDKEKGVMAFVTSIVWYWDNQEIKQVFWDDKDGIHEAVYPERAILMQSTNLRDRNGKEIYEGDILNFPERSGVDHDKSLPNFPGWYGAVRFVIDQDNSRPMYTADIGDVKFMFKWNACEVIGNLYENPELLEASDVG